jgi:hypothetical protein
MSDTATISVEQARRAIDRLHGRIQAFQSAAYERGASIADMDSDPVGYEAARVADEDARLDCWDELARVRELVVGLVAERDRRPVTT